MFVIIDLDEPIRTSFQGFDLLAGIGGDLVAHEYQDPFHPARWGDMHLGIAGFATDHAKFALHWFVIAHVARKRASGMVRRALDLGIAGRCLAKIGCLG